MYTRFFLVPALCLGVSACFEDVPLDADTGGGTTGTGTSDASIGGSDGSTDGSSTGVGSTGATGTDGSGTSMGGSTGSTGGSTGSTGGSAGSTGGTAGSISGSTGGSDSTGGSTSTTGSTGGVEVPAEGPYSLCDEAGADPACLYPESSCRTYMGSGVCLPSGNIIDSVRDCGEHPGGFELVVWSLTDSQALTCFIDCNGGCPSGWECLDTFQPDGATKMVMNVCWPSA